MDLDSTRQATTLGPIFHPTVEIHLGVGIIAETVQRTDDTGPTVIPIIDQSLRSLYPTRVMMTTAAALGMKSERSNVLALTTEQRRTRLITRRLDLITTHLASVPVLTTAMITFMVTLGIVVLKTILALKATKATNRPTILIATKRIVSTVRESPLQKWRRSSRSSRTVRQLTKITRMWQTCGTLVAKRVHGA
ncbi:MAG: hypothetical protein OHK93_004593 [Ramalina farinacea]|uniref:Uncharacterized protein n=1 Tax=Ramalina farinacea TaxID=258253 RepID=A0AA43U0G1_9LECA|nr:hypothetical protein [Ramalina farinacea]